MVRQTKQCAGCITKDPSVSGIQMPAFADAAGLESTRAHNMHMLLEIFE